MTETDVLEAFKGPLRPDGYLFIPIVGGSGTGKSHLVRWVKAQTQNEPDWEIRYLPKNRTGLRRAIEIVIRGLTGPRIEEAREALEAAPSHTESDDILAERLLDELALLVSQVGLYETEPSENQRSAQLRKRLARELPDLLRDPVVRRKLTAAGAVVPRLVGLALRGRHEGDGLDDDATNFLESDFPLTFEEIGHASKGARELLGKFATLPEYKKAAVALINDVLPAAEKHVAVSNQVDLVEVFREVRRALHSDGKQLALFVEDLTVLHGVEREFLDAIVEPVHSVDGDMCGLRMIFAVTDGHFHDLDTVRTRCDDAYWFDAAYGEDGVDEDEALSFVARYFNATRLDPHEIDAAWTSRDSNGERWLRNACRDCIHQEGCHDAFGTSREGYGLYPLDAPAVGRFVRALSAERFDPRDIVREVINRFLIQGSLDLRSNDFPSASTLAVFDQNSEPLAPLIAARVKDLRPADYERVSNILRYWANPESPADISTAILEAFGVHDFNEGLQSLRSLHDSGPSYQRRPEDTTPRHRPTHRGIEDRLKSERRKPFVELTAWANGQRELSATATRYLRQLVQKVVKNNLELGPLPVNLGPGFDESRFRDIDIVLNGSVTQQQSPDTAFVVIERNQVNAAALQALILASEVDTEDWPQAAVYRRMLASAVEAWTRAVVAKLGRPVTNSTKATVQGAIVASAVLDDLNRGLSLTDYMSAMFAPTRALTAGAVRSAKWAALVARAADLKPRLQKLIEAEFGEARGTGSVRMVQADRLLPVVKDFTANWELNTDDPTIAAFFRLVGPAVGEEWTILGKRVAVTQSLVDRDRMWEDQTAKVLATLRTSLQAGRLMDSNAIDELTKLASCEPQRALRAFNTAAEALTKDLTLPEKLTLVASDIPDLVAVVHDFATRAAKAIENVERDLLARQTDAGGATDLEKAATRVLEATNRFDDAIKRLTR
ncbi:hypothetical protein BN971_01874 [Mycobacterium bohemicum DSM 44277]|uniref:Uncharacterized protein n=1 Tax=Mycobacterium bohemicum DSM 44277 TaxID=1236609 RepID=A0A0U0W5P0_MYCBE|nr:hypothetical protein [Mycobacterium bohemicum]CPR10479.1 hypothetical protein BN971_01874 [Mycobacterium bohemicum DSM 44277]